MRQADIAANGVAYDRATVAAFLGDLELSRWDVDAAAQQYDRALDLQPDLVLARVGHARGRRGAWVTSRRRSTSSAR